MTSHYRAHGLTISSEVELPLPVPPTGAGAGIADLTIRLGADRPVPEDAPPGTRLAGLARSTGGVFYVLTRDGERAHLRYPGLCDFTGDRDLSAVTAHPHPAADRELLPVLVAGTLLAAHLMLRHHLVLHASAVELDGHAVAFVGASGMGKSTLAAALCGTGCALVADDVLRVDRVDHAGPAGMVVYPGSTESRLRPNARGLADGAPSTAVRPTADGRLALSPRSHADGPLPLTACVVPRPSRDMLDVSVDRLPPALALMRLCQFPRVLGWCDPPSMDHAFQALADLVERVPVFDATVPWGPPFRPEVLSGLLDAVAR
ncbi:hypothetical protein [Qaidamihabitans albus]|uniref:hypothetical protein n=1 Tax=Qaidamihabitans albus TaxID=2795733 RepID=UPI0018F18607|nr:hypothetical protein [Qaidamihabitans albus]